MTRRINLSMWTFIYSFSDTYYVLAACDLTDDWEIVLLGKAWTRKIIILLLKIMEWLSKQNIFGL